MGHEQRPNIERLKRRRVVDQLARALKHDDLAIQFAARDALEELRSHGVTWDPTDLNDRVLFAIPTHPQSWRADPSDLDTEVVPVLISFLERIVRREWGSRSRDRRAHV